MEINRDLLEKYERGECTEQEIEVVEQWLDHEEWDELPTLDLDQALGQEIWQDVLLHNEAEENAQKEISAVRLKSKKRILFISGIAAGLIACFFFAKQFHMSSHGEQRELAASNKNESAIWLKEDLFDLLLSSNSTANINLKTGCFSLSGDALFKPKQDFSLQDKDSRNSFSFKRGLVYILSRDAHSNKLHVFSEQELNFLPPTIQRRYIQQFQTI